MTSVAQTIPYSPFWRFFVFSMTSIGLADVFNHETSARLTVAATQTGGIDHPFDSAFTSTKKTGAGRHASKADNSPAAKVLVRQVNEWIKIGHWSVYQEAI
jgi:hypothetical protein